MKKLLLILGGFILIVLAAAIVLPFIYKDKIFTLVKETANKEVNAKIDFSNDISLSIFKSFPDLTVSVRSISVAGIDEFEGDTLMSLQEFTATLDIMSVIKGDKIKIEGIILDHPRIHAIVSKDGKANWDITKPSSDTTTTSTDTSETKFNISLKRFAVLNAFIIYDDKKGNLSARLNDFTHELKGDFSQDLFELNTENLCKELTVTFGGISYLNKVNMSFNAGIEANMKEMKFTFKKNEATLNNLKFGFDGWFAMSDDDMNMSLTYNAAKAEFKDFLSLIPAIYAKDFSTLESSGTLAFNGKVNGKYNETKLPAFDFNLKVENGNFKYPALPAPVNAVAVLLNVSNPDGDLNHTVVDLSKAHMEVAGDPFDATLKASDLMKDPLIDATFKGKINLDNITKIVPLDSGMKVSGIITADMMAKGRVSTVENQQYEDFNAAGTLQATKVIYTGAGLSKPFNMNTANITFTPKAVQLNAFEAKIGNSDFNMTGELLGFFGYALGKGTIKGILNFKSSMIDANEFMTPDEGKPAETTNDTSSLDAPEIPGNVDFTLNCAIAAIKYSNMTISDFGGQVHVANQKLQFNKVGLNTLGSRMSMNGYYETTKPKHPNVSMDFGINKLDIQQAFKTFNTVKKLAPIAEKTHGDFSTVLHLNTELDQHLNPVVQSLTAEGVLDIPHADIKDVTVFNKAAELLKYDRLKNPALNNVNIQFKVLDGRIYTKPFDINLAGQKMTLSGSTGLDQTIDYIGSVAIPRSSLGKGNDAVNSLLNSANNKAGTNIKLSEMLNVGLVIKGTFSKPDISTNLNDIAKSEANSLKNQMAAEADRLKKEAEAKLKVEAFKLKKEAENKLKSEADKLKKEAEAKANAEKDKAKKKLEDEAKKQLKGLFGK